MAKAGRKPKFCIHGLKKWDCKICVKGWWEDYYKNYLFKGRLKNGKLHEKYEKEDCEFPFYYLSEQGRAFIKENYWSGSFITKYFLEDRVCEQRKGEVYTLRFPHKKPIYDAE